MKHLYARFEEDEFTDIVNYGLVRIEQDVRKFVLEKIKLSKRGQ